MVAAFIFTLDAGAGADFRNLAVLVLLVGAAVFLLLGRRERYRKRFAPVLGIVPLDSEDAAVAEEVLRRDGRPAEMVRELPRAWLDVARGLLRRERFAAARAWVEHAPFEIPDPDPNRLEPLAPITLLLPRRDPCPAVVYDSGPARLSVVPLEPIVVSDRLELRIVMGDHEALAMVRQQEGVREGTLHLSVGPAARRDEDRSHHRVVIDRVGWIYPASRAMTSLRRSRLRGEATPDDVADRLRDVVRDPGFRRVQVDNLSLGGALVNVLEGEPLGLAEVGLLFVPATTTSPALEFLLPFEVLAPGGNPPPTTRLRFQFLEAAERAALRAYLTITERARSGRESRDP